MYDYEHHIDSTAVVTLDHDQKCSECGCNVPSGAQIEQADWYDGDGDYDDEEQGITDRPPIFTCLVCAEIADAFYCEGRIYGGGLWDAMHEVMGELNTSCLNRLKTPAAKAELQRRWMKWKGIK